MTAPMTFDHVVSLGDRCAVKYQINAAFAARTGRDPREKLVTSQVFDWLITPHIGLKLALKNDFADFVKLENLKILPLANSETVVDTKYRIQHPHAFPRPGQKLSDDYIAQSHEGYAAKMAFLVQRMRNILACNRHKLFVLHGHRSVSEVLEIFELLGTRTSRHHLRFVGLENALDPSWDEPHQLPDEVSFARVKYGAFPGHHESWQAALADISLSRS